jgi:hypothetical protein
MPIARQSKFMFFAEIRLQMPYKGGLEGGVRTLVGC